MCCCMSEYDLRYAASAKPQVCSQIAALGIGTFKMKASALNQPLHFEHNASVDEAVEISAGILERQCVGIYQHLGDL